MTYLNVIYKFVTSLPALTLAGVMHVCHCVCGSLQSFVISGKKLLLWKPWPSYGKLNIKFKFMNQIFFCLSFFCIRIFRISQKLILLRISQKLILLGMVCACQQYSNLAMMTWLPPLIRIYFFLFVFCTLLVPVFGFVSLSVPLHSSLSRWDISTTPWQHISPEHTDWQDQVGVQV